ncbi:isoprenylcysteine carboxylmethyltransferase family protein [Microbispora sp. H11081]|uniref:methyltransferase family protein n=1 Tax=Microbispora sp. H11081 TaxID=2729107 RepID=UPI001472810C|nr:isoprenylcysteine carboxylmethyltransferase family protein [Microbispora sp. H11081]
MLVAAWASLLSYLVLMFLAFGARAWIHRARTGRTGMNGFRGRVFSAEWWAGTLFAVAIALGLLTPILALTGVGEPVAALVAAPIQIAGAALVLLGGAGTLFSQSVMGASWRVGVDERETTALVTTGPFQVARNPIFTAMATASIGWGLLMPSWPALLALVTLVVAVQLQVRVVEEPYLIRAHGPRYLAYASRTGRFVPALGRLRAEHS